MRALMLEAASLGDAADVKALARALAQREIALDRVINPLQFEAALGQSPTHCALLVDGSDNAHGAVPVLYQSLRARLPALAIVVLAPGSDSASRVAWLDRDADDCVGWPSDAAELAARVAAALRCRARRSPPRELRHGAMVLDTARGSVSWRGAAVSLSPREFALLEVFVRHGGRVLSREALHVALHGEDGEVSGNTVEVYVHALRRKLHRHLIRTVRGAGYRLVDVDPAGP